MGAVCSGIIWPVASAYSPSFVRSWLTLLHLLWHLPGAVPADTAWCAAWYGRSRYKHPIQRSVQPFPGLAIAETYLPWFADKPAGFATQPASRSDGRCWLSAQHFPWLLQLG